MVNNQPKINREWLSCPTGDPFADAGGYAFEEFSKHFPDRDAHVHYAEFAKYLYELSKGRVLNYFVFET